MRIPFPTFTFPSVALAAAAVIGSSIVSTCSAQYYPYDYDSRRCSNAEQSRCCEMTLDRFVGARGYCIDNGCNQNICSRKPSSGNNYNGNNAWWGSAGVAVQPSYPATSPYSSPTPPAPEYVESCCSTNQDICPKEFPIVKAVLQLRVCCYTYQASSQYGVGYQTPAQGSSFGYGYGVGAGGYQTPMQGSNGYGYGYGGTGSRAQTYGSSKYQAQTPRHGYSGGYGYHGNRKLQYNYNSPAQGAYSQSFYGASQGYNGGGGYVSSSRGYDYGKSYDLPQCPNVSTPTPEPTPEPTPAPTPAPAVGVYSQPELNGSGCSGETDNVVSIIKHFATTDDDFDSFTSDTEAITSVESFDDEDLADKLAGFKAFVIPDLEEGVAILEDAAETLKEYVENGGVLLVTGIGSYDGLNGGFIILNSIFEDEGWDLQGVSCITTTKNANTVGTPWEDGPDSLECPSGTQLINCGSVDCTVMYGDDPTAASVVVIDVGVEGGKVIFLGFDFYNAGYEVDGEFQDCSNQSDPWVTDIFRIALLVAAGIE